MVDIDQVVWRKHGMLRLGGARQHQQYTMVDPCCEELSEAMHAIKYGHATHGQALRVAAAAEGYLFLCRYYDENSSVRKLRSVRAAIGGGSEDE